MRNDFNRYKFDGETLIRLRRARNLSQAETARRIGIKPQSLCGFEKNRNRPSALTLTKLCDLLDARPQDFFNNK